MDMFLYKTLLPLTHPVGFACVLLIAAGLLRGRKRPFWTVFGTALAVLALGGNVWVARMLARSLEWQNLPQGDLMAADAIVLVGGGLAPKERPRPTIEVGDAGDRTLYTAWLYRQNKAPWVVCTGGIVPGSTSSHPGADDHQEMLVWLGVPPQAIHSEPRSRTTYEDARYTSELLAEKGVRRALLVTSALHMPRTLGVFIKACPGVEFIPAPADFHVVEWRSPPVWKWPALLVPTAGNLNLVGGVVHEYVGIAYYRIRGWL